MILHSKPRLAVVGVGDYYRLIGPGIHTQFDVVLKVDKGDYASVPGALKSLVASSLPDAVMILTPNRFHAEHIEELAPLRVPTFVEKPLVTSGYDLERVRATLAVNPALFCSDFYIDVWDAPMLDWLGLPVFNCLRPFLEISETNLPSRQDLGAIVSVEGVLLEGVGPASSFTGREWLWDPTHGGVLWDMGYHTLALWYRLIGEDLEVKSVERFTVPQAPPGSAETLGTVEFVSTSGITFRMQVGKYVPHEDIRTFTLTGTKGVACMDFVDPSRLTWSGVESQPLAMLQGERLDHGAAVFREYVDSNPSLAYGFDIAEKCVHAMLEIRRH
jgi:predicted dehydrogenase